MNEAAEEIRADPNPLLVAAGPRAAERALLDALAPAIAAARAEPRLLARPVRVVVPSRSLREHLAATLVRAHSGAVVGVAIQTLYAVALEILRRSGQPAAEGTALFPVLVRQLCREERLLRLGLEGLDDGFAVVEASVSDLLAAGFEAAHTEALERDPTLLPSRAFFVHGFADVTGVQTDLLRR